MKSFKGAMSQFYGEQRAQVKAIKERSLVNKARNEAKREQEEAESDQPLHLLRIDGRSVRLQRNDAAFYAQQQNEGLVPWAAHPDVLIDRYDVRSLLDMYVEPDPRVLRHRQRSAQEIELEEQLHFEAYRDLIRLKCLGLSERQGIRHSEQENVAIRAQARSAAVAALAAEKGPKPLPSQHALFSTAAGTGQFAAVGFNYGGGGGGDGGSGDEGEEEEEDSDDDDVPATAEDEDMDRIAVKEFKVEDFSSMLRWAMKEESAEAAASRRRSRRGWSRKKARLRAKRLAGQGLDPALYYKGPPPSQQQQQANDISWIPERKPEDLANLYVNERGSPEYDPMRRSRSRSPSGRRDRPQTEFITTFGSGPAAAAAGPSGAYPTGQRQQQQQVAASSVKDALPGAADPALEGPALLPTAALKLHGIRPEDVRQRERYGSVSGRDYSRAKTGAAAAALPGTTVVKAVDKSKETPQERLKRLMAAQLNKKIQKDSLTAAQKQQQAEAERRARIANEQAAQEAERRDRDREWERQRQRDREEERDASAAAASARGRERERERSRSHSRSPDYDRERERERDYDRPHQRRRSRSRSRSGDRGRYQPSHRSSSDHYRRRSRSRSRDRQYDRQYRSSSRRSPSPSYHRSGSRR